MNQKDKTKNYLEKVVKDLKQYNPEKVILFGSYTRGEAKKIQISTF